MTPDKKAWRDEAIEHLKQYTKTAPASFSMSDVRQWAYGNGCSQPKDERWWASVAQAGKKLGLIDSIGYGISTYPDRPNTGPTYATRWAVGKGAV